VVNSPAKEVPTMPRTFSAALLLTVLVVPWSGRAVAGPPEGASGRMVLDDDVEKFPGTWRVTYVEAGGDHSKGDNDVRLVVKKNILTAKVKGKVVWKATIRLNPEKKPKCIDLDIDEGDWKGKITGIYKFEQNSLTLCLGSAKIGCPKEFASKRRSTDSVTILIREKQ
jgi:uncharacterized protein (TIGR03067 family)